MQELKYLILNFIIKTIRKILFILPVKKNKIVFINYIMPSYSCNLKYILQEIITQKIPCEIVWVGITEANDSSFPEGIKLVNSKKQWQILYELSTAKIWINNGRMHGLAAYMIKKKNSQKYINTWHGSLGIKRIGFSIANKNKRTNSGVKDLATTAKMCDYAISNSSFETEVFKFGLLFENICEWGHPRNDLFFNIYAYECLKKIIYKKYNISFEKKFLLYAPSFRDDMKRMDWFNLDFAKLKNSADKRWNTDFVIAVRLHPQVRKFSNEYIKNSDFLVDVSEYPDIQELMLITDVMITDYSSCIFDFVLARKPGFIYAEDISRYNTERGFYYPLEATPFPIAKDNETLVNNILNFNEATYKQKVEAFLEEKGCIENGTASEKVVNLIKEILK